MRAKRFFCLLLTFMILAVGCKKNSTSESLYWAAEKGDIKMVETFIRKGADVNTKTERGNGSTPLHGAASKGHMDIVKLLIAKGAEVNATDKDGHTPLHEVFFGGHLNIAELLIAEGADVNARDKGSKTPLHKATGSNFSFYASKLLKAKYAEMNANGKQKETSMDEEHELARTLKIKTVKLLISKGADVNARDYLGSTCSV